jgi:hypothetical protein
MDELLQTIRVQTALYFELGDLMNANDGLSRFDEALAAQVTESLAGKRAAARTAALSAVKQLTGLLKK